MKILCTKNNLLSGINIVLKAVPTRTTLNILECILIDTTSGEIKLTANDMELGIETIIEGEVSDKGLIAINAKIFSEIIRRLPEGDVEISTDDSFNVNIKCGKAKFNISGRDGSEFSFLPNVEKERSIYISQFSLKEIVRQTLFSINENDNNKIMTGELFKIIGNRLRVAALDGHRIAIRELELKEDFGEMEVIVPGKTLGEISKILTGGLEDIVKIYFTRNHIVFEFDKTTVVSRLIEGQYFSVEKMVSSDYSTKLKINKKELFSCIERASLLVEVDKKPIVMNIEGSTLKMDIVSSMGSMEENLEINKEGNDIVIGFNPKFFIDALKVIDDEEISIYLSGAKHPCVIKDDDNSYNYVILPVSF
ncbi:MAG: DNA polymerase III subunit beta [Lachnospiraceae bacterium]|nr:DNA polymerase III subunit beta [Lachnospiraceae bacterium]